MEDRHRMAMERMSEHLSRADSELEATQQFLNSRTHEEAELETCYVLWPTPGFWWGTSPRRPG